MSGTLGVPNVCQGYLNGDGLGKGSNLSFCFVIMRGPRTISEQATTVLVPWITLHISQTK